MSSYSDNDRPQHFDVRKVDLLKLTKLVDLEIVIAEADFCLTDIGDQIKAGFDGPEWKKSAERALREIEHKRKLAILKRDALVEGRANAAGNPEDTFKARFIAAAAAQLPPDVYERLRVAARYERPQA